MKVTRAKVSEYDEIQRFLVDAYGHSFYSFSHGWPQLQTKDPENFKNTLLIREKNRIVSLVRIFPLTLVQKGVKIRSAGIGSVATLYSHRGKGCMSKLLLESFRAMRKEQYPISVLWGDRHRYGHFGYENGGACINLKIDIKMVNKSGIKPVDVKRYIDDRKAEAKIKKAYNANSYRQERTDRFFKALYTKKGTATYYAERGKEFAYAVVPSFEASGDTQIQEYGGSGELLLGIFKYMNERFGQSEFLLPCAELQAVPDIALAASSMWTVVQAGMIKILNLKETLKLYSSHPDFFFPDGEEVTFTIKNGESVTLAKTKGRLSIESKKGKNEVVLDENEMVRLLFGTSFWTPAGIDAKLFRLLRIFLPFKFFVWKTDKI